MSSSAGAPPGAAAAASASAPVSAAAVPVPVSFRGLERLLPGGWSLRDCGGGGHCLYLCVAAMLFGVDEAAGPGGAAAAVAPRTRPSSHSWMLARWLRGLVCAFLQRDECVTAMLQSGMHGNMEREAGESDQRWLRRFKDFHLRAADADGRARPPRRDDQLDADWSALARCIQATSRYATDLDLLVLVHLFRLRLSCYVPYHAAAQEYDGSAPPLVPVPDALLVLMSSADFPLPRLPSTTERAPLPPLHVANAVEHFKLAVRSDARGQVHRQVDGQELRHTWSHAAAVADAPIHSPFIPPDLAALKDWYSSQKWAATADKEILSDSVTKSELSALFHQVHQRPPADDAELDDLRVSRELYERFTQRQRRVDHLLQSADPDDAGAAALEQEQEQAAASVPLTVAYRQILSAADNKQQAERLETLLLAGPVEQHARLQMSAGGMSAEDISSTCANAACILSVGESLHKRTSKVQTVGDVQSGKTASMEALTAKAIDNDYDLVLMLSGTNNVLRAQTQ